MPSLSSRLALALTCATVGAPAVTRAAETVAVIAVAEPPLGPGPELVGWTHQLRTACRDRSAGIEDVAEMRARLGGQLARPGEGSQGTLGELERAYVGAQAAFQADEIDSALRTFQALVQDVERLPESAAGYLLWIRAHLRIALAERTRGHRQEMARAMERVLALEPAFVLDAEQFAPSFRREFDEVRQGMARRPRSRLTVTSPGQALTAYLNGKELGETPVTLELPPGRYRVGGALGELRVPAVQLVLGGGEDRAVTLDLPLAEAVRPTAGPGLALPAAQRGAGIVRAGAWLGVDRVIAVELPAGGQRLLAGAVYDVAAGALVREGSTRLVAAGSPSATAVGALASFLLTGQPSLEVRASTPAAQRGLVAAPPQARPRWLRPAAYAAGAVALGLGLVATTQALASRDGYREAGALVRADGALVAGADLARYDALVGGADRARRNAYLGAAGAAAFTIVAGVLGYLSFDARGAPAVRF